MFPSAIRPTRLAIGDFSSGSALKGVLEALALNLKIRGALDVTEAFIDGSFAPAKKGDPKSARQSVARDRSGTECDRYL